MDRQADRLALVGQSALDRLLDPPGGVGAELAALGGIETLDGLHQADVALGNEVEQRQAEIRVIVRDLDHEPQVGADHQGARLAVALLDFRGQLDLLVGSQKRDLPDLTQVNLYSSIRIFGSHITFHEKGKGKGKGDARSNLPWFPVGAARLVFVLTFLKVVNNVKY